MTVCVAALASGGSCIICIADKALSYGEYIQWDSDTTKIMPLPSCRGVLMASGGEHSSRVINALLENDSIGDEISKSIKIVETVYQRCFDEVLEIKFIKQNGLTRDRYLDAVSSGQLNRHIEHLADKIERFNLDVDILVCGYDNSKIPQPYLLSVTSPGQVIDISREGFHAIGSGYEHAVARLLFQEHKRTHGLSEGLYGCFDAKAHAELASSVGYEWNAYFFTSDGIVSIEDETRQLVERIWAKASRTPFYKQKSDDLKGPPRDWRAQLSLQVRKSFERIGIPSLGEGVVVINPPPKQPAWLSRRPTKADQSSPPPSPE
jgi:hypothetical protein